MTEHEPARLLPPSPPSQPKTANGAKLLDLYQQLRATDDDRTSEAGKPHIQTRRDAIYKAIVETEADDLVGFFVKSEITAWHVIEVDTERSEAVAASLIRDVRAIAAHALPPLSEHVSGKVEKYLNHDFGEFVPYVAPEYRT